MGTGSRGCQSWILSRRPVVDNNTRAAMLQTGEAQFAFPIPYEQAPLLAKNSKLELVASRRSCSATSA